MDVKDMGDLRELVSLWGRSRIPEEILSGGSASVPEVSRAYVVAGLAEVEAPLLVVLPRSRDAEAFQEALRAWMEPGRVALFPAWEVLPGEAMSPTLHVMGARLRVLHDLARGRGPAVVVTSVRALLQKVAVPEVDPVVLRTGERIDIEELTRLLVSFGYERNYLVERPGEFSVRGGIVDVYPPGLPPVRADFFGDEISELREFGISSQRSEDSIDALEILPTRELLPDKAVRRRAGALLEQKDPEMSPDTAADLQRLAEGLMFPGAEGYLGIVGEDLRPVSQATGARIVLCDPKGCRDRSEEFLEQAGQWGGEAAASLFESFDAVTGQAAPVELWAYARADEAVTLEVTGWDEHIGRPDRLAERLRSLLKEGATAAVAAGGGAERAREVLAEAGLGLPVGTPRPGAPAVSREPVEHGFLLRFDEGGPEPLALVGEADLFGRRRPRRRAAPEEPARATALLLDLAAGDYVVHESYGVGRYHGMVTREVAGVTRDYLVISYAGDDRLYLPTEQLETVTKYTGGESPRLNRLGSGEWEKAKSRARRAVADIAGELMVLYSKRMQAEGHTFSPDTPWQRQLEDAFAHVETPDQARAIDEVKRDMELARPMDRLVCGDVGYGKTEIAVRAAFKAIQDSKQVAVLVPTTILAQQHLQTFSDRFAPFPLNIAQLSRFLTPLEQEQVVDQIATGKMDIVIGTHRLLQADVRFHDLGLLVVDEEQRFGVQHKEKIKKLRESVDVMTMTATPIPRTLEMAITTIRDLSLIDTPPPERRPVLTYVGEADDRMITAAIRRELARDGQVFFVHNRVRSIKRVARKIASLVPGARVEIAHGQMAERDLEAVMVDVWDGKIDVLVCTTIIESGLDIPAMNTLIVERADLLGLAQLYQLRGRVGRAGERAYAYFLFPHQAALTEEAHERLKVLSEFTELGSGFKIALRDLEIRGAGNLLGAQQSGHIAAVGFDLYMKMMGDAVAEMSGRPAREQVEVAIDIPVDAFIPASYIARESLRMDAYRQIEKVRSHADAEGLREEFEDRYGPLPDAVENLLVVAEIRAEMAAHGIDEAVVRDGTLRLKPLHPGEDDALYRLVPDATYKPASETLLLPVPAHRPASWVLETLRAILA
jgi:transcription-repair coupling factor (superfamily II helicase)